MRNPFAGTRFLTSAADPSGLPPPDRGEAAFAGRSNAGKSSALNAICAQKALARVSKTPGRTQLLNFFELTGARLVDLPGYGYAEVPHAVRRDWGMLVGGFIESRPNLRGLILVMDIRRPLTDFDRQLLAWAAVRNCAVHVLLTKCDKLATGAAKNMLREVQAGLPTLHAGASVQLFSATRKIGIEEARAVLAGWLGM
jgi:GTP-binding protein